MECKDRLSFLLTRYYNTVLGLGYILIYLSPSDDGTFSVMALDGNKVLSFSLSGWTSEVWKTGTKLGRLAKSSVTVDFFVSVIVC
jgi:hypothetical protein